MNTERVSLELLITQYLSKQEGYCFWALSSGHRGKLFISFLQHCLAVMWQSITPGAGASANASALPTLLAVVCSRRAAIPSPLLRQQVGKPGHGSDLVCKHTYWKRVLLGCCSFCFTWAAVLHRRLWGTLPPQLGLASLFTWSEERDPIKTRPCVGRGQGWRQTSPVQPAIARGDGSCEVKTVSGGSVPTGRGTHCSRTKKLGQGRRERWGRWARARTAGEPAQVCNRTCVFMAEPTWRWKWIFHRTRFRNTQTVSSYTSTAQSKSWGDSFSFRTSWIL